MNERKKFWSHPTWTSHLIKFYLKLSTNGFMSIGTIFSCAVSCGGWMMASVLCSCDLGEHSVVRDSNASWLRVSLTPEWPLVGILLANGEAWSYRKERTLGMRRWWRFSFSSQHSYPKIRMAVGWITDFPKDSQWHAFPLCLHQLREMFLNYPITHPIAQHPEHLPHRIFSKSLCLSMKGLFRFVSPLDQCFQMSLTIVILP